MGKSNLGIFYYYISFLSGVVELGSLFWGLSRGYSLFPIIGLVTAYQLGNVLQYFVPKKIEHYSQYFLCVALGTCIAAGVVGNQSMMQYIFMAVTLLVGSTFLQLEREAVKIKVEEWEKWKKRAFRVLGFFASATIALSCGTWILCVILVSLIVIGFISEDFGYDDWFSNFKKKDVEAPKVCWSMVTHQAHYFVYTYVLCAMVFYHSGNAFWAAVCMVMNWIPYTITEPLVKVLKIEKYYGYISICAHLFNCMVLAGVYVCLVKGSIPAAVLLWMLTGFGGGNIFCVKKYLKSNIDYDNDTWMFSEQVGHILGMVTCMIIVVFFKPEYTMLAAAFFALITAPIISITMMYYGKRKRNVK